MVITFILFRMQENFNQIHLVRICVSPEEHQKGQLLFFKREMFVSTNDSIGVSFSVELDRYSWLTLLFAYHMSTMSFSSQYKFVS